MTCEIFLLRFFFPLRVVGPQQVAHAREAAGEAKVAPAEGGRRCRVRAAPEAVGSGLGWGQSCADVGPKALPVTRGAVKAGIG